MPEALTGRLLLVGSFLIAGVFFKIGSRDAMATENPYRHLRYPNPNSFKRNWPVEKINQSGFYWQIGALGAFILMFMGGLGVFPLEGADPVIDW